MPGPMQCVQIKSIVEGKKISVKVGGGLILGLQREIERVLWGDK